MILAAGYLLFMYGRIVFGEVSDFLDGLGDHLTDMTPVEILTLVPLGDAGRRLRRPARAAARPRSRAPSPTTLAVGQRRRRRSPIPTEVVVGLLAL